MNSETLIARYATPEELQQVQAARDAVPAAGGELRRIGEALAQTGEALQEARVRQVRWNARAAARALGEAVPELESGPTVAELQGREQGLVERMRSAQKEFEHAQGNARATWMELLAACARRCMEDYVALTEKQAWCHAQLAAAQIVLGEGVRIVDDLCWRRYYVPGSDHVCRHAARVENGMPVLASSDRETLTVPPLAAELRWRM